MHKFSERRSYVRGNGYHHHRHLEIDIGIVIEYMHTTQQR